MISPSKIKKYKLVPFLEIKIAFKIVFDNKHKNKEHNIRLIMR